MKSVIHPARVYERGLIKPESLSSLERLVFLLLDFQNVIDMEGWDHFFMDEERLALYPELKQWLSDVGDRTSLAILEDYERHLGKHGIALEPNSLQAFLSRQKKSYFRSSADWRDLYTQAEDQRWQKVREYLNKHAVQLEDN